MPRRDGTNPQRGRKRRKTLGRDRERKRRKKERDVSPSSAHKPRQEPIASE
jgi:hypothetical protein